MKNLFLTIILFLFTTPSAYGAKTKWQDIGLGASIRLFTDNVKQEDGTRFLAIELKMPKSVKTYWRIPGETGIPLDLKLTNQEQEIPFEIIWAYPKPENQYGTYDFVYYGSLIIPVKISSSDAKSIKADIFLGICENICIPANVSLELDLTGTKIKRANNLRLAQAISNAPINWSEAKSPINNIMLNIEKGIVEFDYDSNTIDANSIILDNGDLNTLFSAPLIKQAEKRVYFQLLDTSQAEKLIDKPIKITFLTNQGAYQLIKTIKKSQ